MNSVDSQLLDQLLEDLGEREKTVIMGRFGLGKFNESQSLASLGDKYGITRERVRQIEESSLDKIKEKIAANQLCAEIVSRGLKYLKENGGVAREEDFVDYHQSFFPGIGKNHFYLIIETAAPFSFHPQNEDFWPFYYSDDEQLGRAKGFVKNWINFLKKKKEEILAEANYKNHFKNFSVSWKIHPAHAENYVKISRQIHINPYGDVGLADWPEIKPSTTRDLIYLILKKKNQPIHFREIADAINDSQLSARKSLAATVHNELIKDKRFVLVGRGIYGLKENGYEPGTASEVIKRVIRKNGPLSPREIISEIQKERFLKPNTILVNLQNRKMFQRLPDGTYQIRN